MRRRARRSLRSGKHRQRKGDALAQYNLGVFYRQGRQGVKQDYATAYAFLNIAATNGNKLGAELRDDLEKEMTPADISAAQKLARECVRKKYKGC